MSIRDVAISGYMRRDGGSETQSQDGEGGLYKGIVWITNDVTKSPFQNLA